MSRPFHRPMQPGDAFFDHQESGVDPLALREAADRAATLIVRGARESEDDHVADRLLALARTEGLETLAELWAGASPESLAGCLWRLFALREWVYADPRGAADQFAAGRASAEFARVVAGVADPPGPDELREMVDQVLRGIAERDLADVLVRAAAFARVIATGRASLPVPHEDVVRMLSVAEQLERGAALERRGELD